MHDIFERRDIKVTFTKEEAQTIITTYFGPQKRDSRTDWYIFGVLYSIASDEAMKKSWSEKTHEKLQHEFRYEMYYLSGMFDIIIPREDLTAAYTAYIETIIKEGQRRHPFERKEYYTDNRLGDYLNYCWKHQIKVSESLLTGLASVSDYYAWLLNLDGFDYALFQAEWIAEYFTKYYKERFRLSLVLKKHLWEQIRNKKSLELDHHFSIIYASND